jgi:hypothetical protein
MLYRRIAVGHALVGQAGLAGQLSLVIPHCKKTNRQVFTHSHLRYK